MTDEEWRAWLTGPLPLSDALAVELAELRRQYLQDVEAREQAVRDTVARRAGRPSYADLCDLRGEHDRAARARAQLAGAFDGMAEASRAVHRRRWREARRSRVPA